MAVFSIIILVNFIIFAIVIILLVLNVLNSILYVLVLTKADVTINEWGMIGRAEPNLIFPNN